MPRQPYIALALIRVVVGIVFVAHGFEKIMWGGLRPLVQQFEIWNVPMPLLTAPLVATLESIGGILLILGLAARTVAFGLSVVMIGAIWYVHLGNPNFFGPQGLEVPLLLLGGSLAVWFGGPGLPSMDTVPYSRFPYFRRRVYEEDVPRRGP